MKTKMADGAKEMQPSAKQNRKTLKRTSDTQSEDQSTNNDVIEQMSCLQTICKYFGVGGLYSNKKRKIDTHKETLPILNDEWLNLDVIKKLSTEEKKKYAKEMSPITFQNLTNLRKMLAFFNKVNNSTDRKQVKDLTMDYLLKDLKTNPSLPIPERYCEMGLWKQIMKMNQQVWKNMESLEEQDQKEMSNGSEKDLMHSVKSKVSPISTVDSSIEEKKTFRDFYMDMITSNCSDDLDKIRKDSSLDHKKISVLIDCLETGKDIWSDVEKELLQSLDT